jgi:hypothetical protein
MIAIRGSTRYRVPLSPLARARADSRISDTFNSTTGLPQPFSSMRRLNAFCKRSSIAVSLRFFVWCRKDRSAAAFNAPRMGIFFGRITPGTPPCSIVKSNSRSTSKTILPGYDGCDESSSATDGSWGWMHTAYGDPTAVHQMDKARWPNSSCRRRHEFS